MMIPCSRVDELNDTLRNGKSFSQCLYVGFYTRQPDIVRQDIDGDKLLAAIEASKKLYPFTPSLDWALGRYDSILKRDVVSPEQAVVELPRRISDVDDTTIVMFLDEFQNTRLPQYKFSIVGPWLTFRQAEREV